MKPALVLALALSCTMTRADTIGVHLASQHYPAQEWNNVNPGLYYIWDNGATVGAYRNSYSRTSAYVGYTYQWGWLGLTAGLISGYPTPVFLAPSIRIPLSDQVAIRLVALPKYEKRGSAVLHLTMEWHF